MYHFARSAGRKGVVIWGGTKWIQLGYKQNKNVNKWWNKWDEWNNDKYEPQDPTLMSDNFVARQIKNEKDGCLITEGKEKASNLSAEEYVKNGRQGDYLACDDNGKPLNKPKQVNPSKKASGKQPYIQDRVFHEDGKSHALTAEFAARTNVATKPKQVGVAVDLKGHDIIKRVYSPEGKSPTINAHSGGNTEPKVVTGGAMRARSKNKDGKHVEWKETTPQQMLELRKDEKSNSISTVSKDSLVVQSYREVRTDEAKKARKEARQKTGKDHTPFRSKKLEPRDDGKVGTVTPSLNKDHEISMIREKSKTVRSGGRGSYDRHEWDSVDEMHWRKLTPLECERLQTVPDGYTEGVSNTQRYRMLGNGWTVDVIAHILTNMEK